MTARQINSPQKRKLIGKIKWAKDTKEGKIQTPIPGTCGAFDKLTNLPCTSTDLYPNGRCKLHGGVSGEGESISLGRSENAAFIKSKIAHKNNLFTTVRNRTENGKKKEVNIYEVGLLEEEKGTIYSDIMTKIGTLDAEINMARILLRRSLWGQKRQIEAREELAKHTNDFDQWIAIAEKYGYLSLDRYEVKKNSTNIPPNSKKVFNGKTYCIAPSNRRYLQDIARERITRRKHDYLGDINKWTNVIRKLEGQRKELTEDAKDASEEFIAAIAGDLRSFAATVITTVPGKSEFGKGNYKELKRRDEIEDLEDEIEDLENRVKNFEEDPNDEIGDNELY